MTPEQADNIVKLANEKGLDFSTTIDGKGIKFIHFGDEAGLDDFHQTVAEIAQEAGSPEVVSATVRSGLNATQDYIAAKDRGEREKIWYQDRPTGSPDLFRRSVDNVLAPYIRLLEQEGYRFSTPKFADLFGHSEEKARLIEEATLPRHARPVFSHGARPPVFSRSFTIETRNS